MVKKKKDRRPKILKELDQMSDEEIVEREEELLKRSKFYSIEGVGLLIVFIVGLILFSIVD